jgi:hypothetical protein
LFIAFAIMGGLFILNRRNVHSLFPYLIEALPCGISCWIRVHATHRRIIGICDSVWQWRQENILVSTAAFYTSLSPLLLFC